MALFKKRAPEPPPPAPAPALADGDDHAPGWDAIDAALAPVYGDQEPVHVSFGDGQAFGDALQGASAYAREDHWHYVTYGLSNLFGEDEEEILDESDRPLSGWGIELTMRVRRGAESAPPVWPFLTLNGVAEYVDTGHPLRAGSRLDLAKPITGHPDTDDGPPTGLTVLAMAVDPELGEIEAPDGVVTFLQAVGVTATEKAEMVGSRTATVLDRFTEHDPLLVTDPTRA